MQPRRSAPKEGDNVTAARDPGRVTANLYSRIATSLRSLGINLLYIYTYYHSHPCLQPMLHVNLDRESQHHLMSCIRMKTCMKMVAVSGYASGPG